MRLIDADKLMLSLNDNYLANSPTGNETLEVQNYRESMCEGLEIAMATVEGAPTVGGWISVKDRLPIEKENPLTQDFAEVICYCDFGGIPKRTDVRVYKFGKRTWTEEGHFWLGGQCMDGVITHWMPLPEPPKGERTE